VKEDEKDFEKRVKRSEIVEEEAVKLTDVLKVLWVNSSECSPEQWAKSSSTCQ